MAISGKQSFFRSIFLPVSKRGLKCGQSLCFLPQELLATVSTFAEVKTINTTSVTVHIVSRSFWQCGIFV